MLVGLGQAYSSSFFHIFFFFVRAMSLISWSEIATASGPSTGHELDEISAVCCDPFYEMVWTGTKEVSLKRDILGMETRR